VLDEETPEVTAVPEDGWLVITALVGFF